MKDAFGLDFDHGSDRNGVYRISWHVFDMVFVYDCIWESWDVYD